MGYFGFDQLNSQYLEPPDDSHHYDCENERWYWCDWCQIPFVGDSSNGTPVNMHDENPLCKMPFAKLHDECVCQWLGER